ncbi:MAG: hypothetical protein GQ531_07685 [Sulfurovum sp.]|nr:hypothetical protein [Sulfurovum sp.]
MNKTILLSLVTSTMIMAGGDIAPVESVAPEASLWDFSGQAVAFTQTVDSHGTKDLFHRDSTYASLGIQLRAINKDLFAGIGAGVEVSAIGQSSSLTDIPDNENSFAFPFIGGGDAQVESAALTQAYLTYDFGNTAIKIGRQTMSKSISPFAYSEGWQVFKNTMDTALIVNKDLSDTTLIYAAFGRANSSIGRLDNFDLINENGNVLHMGTVQNKSFEGLTLTGTYYYAPDFAARGVIDDLSILWGDVNYNFSDYYVAFQGGTLGGMSGLKDTNAWGAKVGGSFGIFGVEAAYSSVNDGDHRVTNMATVQNPAPGVGIKSPLYTQSVLDNIGNHHAINADWIKLSASAKALGGKFGVAFAAAVDNYSSPTPNPVTGVIGAGSYFGPNPFEVDVTYKTKVTEDITLFAAYVYTDRDHDNINIIGDPTFVIPEEGGNNFVRLWARYNF